MIRAPRLSRARRKPQNELSSGSCCVAAMIKVERHVGYTLQEVDADITLNEVKANISYMIIIMAICPNGYHHHMIRTPLAFMFSFIWKTSLKYE